MPVGVDAIPLAEEWMGPVMVPAIADRPPAEVVRLHSETRPRAWEQWVQQSGWQPGGGDMRYEHFYLAIQAAQAGQGVALASIHMVAADIRGGTLRAPHGFARDGTRYHALRPASVASERTERFIGWLRRRLDEHVAIAAAAVPASSV